MHEYNWEPISIRQTLVPWGEGQRRRKEKSAIAPPIDEVIYYYADEYKKAHKPATR